MKKELTNQFRTSLNAAKLRLINMFILSIKGMKSLGKILDGNHLEAKEKILLFTE